MGYTQLCCSTRVDSSAGTTGLGTHKSTLFLEDEVAGISHRRRTQMILRALPRLAACAGQSNGNHLLAWIKLTRINCRGFRRHYVIRCTSELRFLGLLTDLLRRSFAYQEAPPTCHIGTLKNTTGHLGSSTPEEGRQSAFIPVSCCLLGHNDIS